MVILTLTMYGMTGSHYLIRDIISIMAKNPLDITNSKLINAINLLYEKLAQAGIETAKKEITLIDKKLKIK